MVISAAGRLRRLYPDVAGLESPAAVVGPRRRNTPTNSTSDGTTSRGGGGDPLALEITSEEAGRRDEAGEGSGNARNLFQRKARHVRAAMRLRMNKGRCPRVHDKLAWDTCRRPKVCMQKGEGGVDIALLLIGHAPSSCPCDSFQSVYNLGPGASRVGWRYGAYPSAPSLEHTFSLKRHYLATLTPDAPGTKNMADVAHGNWLHINMPTYPPTPQFPVKIIVRRRVLPSVFGQIRGRPRTSRRAPCRRTA